MLSMETWGPATRNSTPEGSEKRRASGARAGSQSTSARARERELKRWWAKQEALEGRKQREW